AVDAGRLVAFQADDVQAARLHDAAMIFLDVGFFLHLLDAALPFIRGDVVALLVAVAELGPGEGFGVAAQGDVGAAAGHVGGHRHRGGASGLGDDVGFAVETAGLGVEHLVGDAGGGEALAEDFRLVHGAGADEDGAAGLVHAGDLGDGGVEL